MNPLLNLGQAETSAVPVFSGVALAPMVSEESDTNVLSMGCWMMLTYVDMFPNFQQSNHVKIHIDWIVISKDYILNPTKILLQYFRINIIIRQWVKTQYSYN